jgi:hypothetical protein
MRPRWSFVPLVAQPGAHLTHINPHPTDAPPLPVLLFGLFVIHARALNSVEFKFNFDADLHGHWLSIFQGRIEAPPLHGLHCLCVQPEPESVDDPNVVRMPGCVNNQP